MYFLSKAFACAWVAGSVDFKGFLLLFAMYSSANVQHGRNIAKRGGHMDAHCSIVATNNRRELIYDDASVDDALVVSIIGGILGLYFSCARSRHHCCEMQRWGFNLSWLQLIE